MVDARISIIAADFTVPAGLEVGGQIDLYSAAACDSTLVLVRDRVADEPLLIHHNGYPPELADPQRWLDIFGKTWDELTAPLGLHFVEAGQCPVVVDGNYLRGSLDVTRAGYRPARVLETLSGAGPGGYFVSNRWTHFHQDFGWIYGGYGVFRDACVDCPPPTFHDGCLDVAEPAIDEFSIAFYYNGEFQDNQHSAWHFECTVIASDVVVDEEGRTVEQRDLDCAALFQSFTALYCT